MITREALTIHSLQQLENSLATNNGEQCDRYIARAAVYAELAKSAPVEEATGRVSLAALVETKPNVNAELLAACEESICIFTGWDRENLEKAIAEQYYVESPYHYLYKAITNARAEGKSS